MVNTLILECSGLELLFTIELITVPWWTNAGIGTDTPWLPYDASKLHLLDKVLMVTSSNGNIFRVTGPLWGEFTGHRWIPLTEAGGAELWCFLWSALD